MNCERCHDLGYLFRHDPDSTDERPILLYRPCSCELGQQTLSRRERRMQFNLTVTGTALETLEAGK